MNHVNPDEKWRQLLIFIFNFLFTFHDLHKTYRGSLFQPPFFIRFITHHIYQLSTTGDLLMGKP
jgi:hypothetical protein